MSASREQRAGGTPNRVRLTVAAVAALAAGAVAAPAALAAGPTPLVQTIEKAQKATDIKIDENFESPSGDRTAIQALVANAYATQQAVNTVARTPAIKSQQAGKADWLSGERGFIREDVLLAGAAYTILGGQKTTGEQEVHTLLTENNRYNGLVGRADEALDIR